MRKEEGISRENSRKTREGKKVSGRAKEEERVSAQERKIDR